MVHACEEGYLYRQQLQRSLLEGPDESGHHHRLADGQSHRAKLTAVNAREREGVHASLAAHPVDNIATRPGHNITGKLKSGESFLIIVLLVQEADAIP